MSLIKPQEPLARSPSSCAHRLLDHGHCRSPNPLDDDAPLRVPCTLSLLTLQEYHEPGMGGWPPTTPALASSGMSRSSHKSHGSFPVHAHLSFARMSKPPSTRFPPLGSSVPPLNEGCDLMSIITAHGVYMRSPPMTTSPPRMAPDSIMELIECGTTPAVIGNSTGAVLTMRTTLPEPGVSRTQKKGRSQPSSV